VRLTCEHQYCAACLKDYILSARGSGGFPVVCIAVDAGEGCNHTIALEVMQRVLTTEQERLVLNSALSSYIQRHPRDFRYCPTADCDWIYKTQLEGTVLLCEACLQHICASCNVLAHEGITCKEYGEVSTPEGRAYLDYKRANNVKPCPGCGADIFKDGGCNHVQCRGCNTHMCWVCMKSFEVSDIYRHMSSAHGGIGI